MIAENTIKQPLIWQLCQNILRFSEPGASNYCPESRKNSHRISQSYFSKFTLSNITFLKVIKLNFGCFLNFINKGRKKTLKMISLKTVSYSFSVSDFECCSG
jgi:hypothetical protein